METPIRAARPLCAAAPIFAAEMRPALLKVQPEAADCAAVSVYVSPDPPTPSFAMRISFETGDTSAAAWLSVEAAEQACDALARQIIHARAVRREMAQ